MKRYTGLLFLLIFTSLAQAQLYRTPALSPDGKMLAFTYQGDIWVVNATGGEAKRLTVQEANEGLPKFSPDGKFIAYTSARFGNNDIFVIPVAGGTARRVTFHSASDNLTAWNNDGSLYFSTVREYQQSERDPEVYAINSIGGTEKRLLDALGSDAVLSPDSKFIAFTRGGSNPVFRESYTGSANKDIWIYNIAAKTFSKVIASEKNDYLPQWGNGNTLFYLSSLDGKYNLYKVALSPEGERREVPEKLTDYKDYAVRSYTVSEDGKTIVIEQANGLFSSTGGSSFKPVSITLAAESRLNAEEYRIMSRDANEYAVSPNGKLVALAVRGEIFIKEVDKDKSRSVNVSGNPYRDVNPQWLSDTTLIFASDRNDGNYELYLVKSADKTQPNLFKTLKREVVRLTKTDDDEADPVLSPDGKKIAYTRGGGTLVVADINGEGTLSNAKELLKGWATAENIAWSPDSKWLAYSLDDLYFNKEVFIHAADNSAAPVNISMHPRDDSNPVWSPDGSKLGFLSARNNRSRDVWFVWLKKEDWEKTKQDWEDREAPKKDEKADKKDSVKTKPVKIDFDGISERVVQVTNFPGDEGNPVISKDGEVFYYTAASSTAKGYDLYSIKWDGKDLKELTKGGQNPGSVTADKDVAYLFYFKQGGAFNRHDLKGDKQEAIPYSLKMKIDNLAEREQMYEEAWRAIRDGFYDPQFHGNNWNKLHDKYKPLCLAASTENDFRDMFNYMLGELNASHMGMYPGQPGGNDPSKDATGLLGAELEPAGNGMLVKRVVPGSPADKQNSKLKAGDVITAVDGVTYNANSNFYELLRNRVDEQVVLSVTSGGANREVVIRPTANLRQLLYKEWVEDRKKLTDKYSNGKLGYIHIQGMDMVSFEEFERKLTEATYGKEGLVIDVRYNGGGFTTDYLMTVLNYKQHAYTIPRGASENLEKDKLKFRNYYPTGERLVFAAYMKPSITLCNESSYSNAEIFSHAYKTLGIGKLVGVTTNGSVISTGAKGLVDGSYVRLPFRGWYTKATDVNQELNGAVPDFTVTNSVNEKALNVDEQLKKAVEQLLSEK